MQKSRMDVTKAIGLASLAALSLVLPLFVYPVFLKIGRAHV